MRNPSRLLHLLEGVSYRPGWTITLEDEAWRDGFITTAIRVSAWVDDATKPGHKCGLSSVNMLPWPATYMPTRMEFLEYLFSVLKKIELHECGEFLRVHGKAPFNPHGPEAIDQ